MSLLSNWLCLLGSIVLEVAGTSIMKASQDPHFIVGAAVGMATMFALIGLSYYLLSRAVEGIPVGVAFACWEGLGLALITLVSVLYFGERMDSIRGAALLAILGGVMLVHKGTEHGAEENRASAQRGDL